jgi:pimeloyl-ACP methyl ester carboxylesterase
MPQCLPDQRTLTDSRRFAACRPDGDEGKAAKRGGRWRLCCFRALAIYDQRKTANPAGTFSTADIDEYERVYRKLGNRNGMLGYYRAIFEDMAQNAELAKTRVKTPILALGGDRGSAPDIYEAMKPLCEDVRGGVIKDSGHYIPEEQPVVLAVLGFEAAFRFKWCGHHDGQHEP